MVMVSVLRFVTELGPGFWIALVVLTPLLVVVHELGHATVGLALGDGPVHVSVGRRPPWLRFMIGRLTLELNPLIPLVGPAGFARTAAPLSRRLCLAHAAGGPAANFAVAAAALGAMATAGRATWLVAVAATSASYGLWNLVPRRTGTEASDGLRLLRLVKGLDTESYEQTRLRWATLVTERRNEVVAGDRGRRLAGVATHLGLAVTPSRELASAATMAIAGWCWREAGGTHAERHERAFHDAYGWLVAHGALDWPRARRAFDFGAAVRAAEDAAAA
jgi:hypothetical protein